MDILTVYPRDDAGSLDLLVYIFLVKVWLTSVCLVHFEGLLMLAVGSAVERAASGGHEPSFGSCFCLNRHFQSKLLLNAHLLEHMGRLGLAVDIVALLMSQLLRLLSGFRWFYFFESSWCSLLVGLNNNCSSCNQGATLSFFMIFVLLTWLLLLFMLWATLFIFLWILGALLCWFIIGCLVIFFVRDGWLEIYEGSGRLLLNFDRVNALAVVDLNSYLLILIGVSLSWRVFLPNLFSPLRQLVSHLNKKKLWIVFAYKSLQIHLLTIFSLLHFSLVDLLDILLLFVLFPIFSLLPSLLLLAHLLPLTTLWVLPFSSYFLLLESICLASYCRFLKRWCYLALMLLRYWLQYLTLCCLHSILPCDVIEFLLKWVPPADWFTAFSYLILIASLCFIRFKLTLTFLLLRLHSPSLHSMTFWWIILFTAILFSLN